MFGVRANRVPHWPIMAETSNSQHDPPRKGLGTVSRQMAVAMELPFLIVGAVATGAFFGYLLDGWLGTQPWFLLLLGLLGLFAGVREMLRRLFPKKPQNK